MYTRSKKGIKVKMETTIGLYGKGNEIIFLITNFLGKNNYVKRMKINI